MHDLKSMVQVPVSRAAKIKAATANAATANAATAKSATAKSATAKPAKPKEAENVEKSLERSVQSGLLTPAVAGQMISLMPKPMPKVAEVVEARSSIAIAMPNICTNRSDDNEATWQSPPIGNPLSSLASHSEIQNKLTNGSPLVHVSVACRDDEVGQATWTRELPNLLLNDCDGVKYQYATRNNITRLTDLSIVNEDVPKLLARLRRDASTSIRVSLDTLHARDRNSMLEIDAVNADPPTFKNRKVLSHTSVFHPRSSDYCHSAAMVYSKSFKTDDLPRCAMIPCTMKDHRGIIDLEAPSVSKVIDASEFTTGLREVTINGTHDFNVMRHYKQSPHGLDQLITVTRGGATIFVIAEVDVPAMYKLIGKFQVKANHAANVDEGNNVSTTKQYRRKHDHLKQSIDL